MSSVDRIHEICRRNSPRPSSRHAAAAIPPEVFEDIKACAAREIWSKSTQRISRQVGEARPPTWREWFEDKFGEDLVVYVHRVAKEKASATA